jgi:glycosyltransferase involved in cell wall biosynthesis
MSRLRIGFFYPQKCMNEPLDPPNIWTAKRGLTGSELACVQYATELARLGHSVNLFTKVNHAADKDGVIYIPYDEWRTTYCNQNWDSLLSWMNPEALKIAPPGAFRFFNQQVSDFGGCESGWEQYVDILAPLSYSHAKHVAPMCNMPQEKWRVLYNGTDTSFFRPAKKQPYKMIWASSHDRGLHWLLELFPSIKKQVPQAELHIFYNSHGIRSFASIPQQNLSDLTPGYPDGHPWTVHNEELGRRARYTLEAMRRLSDKGVVFHDSVGRDRIRDEMASASVLAYPLDPVRYTETFGVTVLEAIASGAIPVLCLADAFEELWGTMGYNVPAPYQQHKPEFLKKLIMALNVEESNINREIRLTYAKNFEWKTLAKNLEAHLVSRGTFGLPNPWEDR